MALDDASIQYHNRLINCIDIGKDAMIKFITGGKENGLTNTMHGRFLKDEVIFPLFNGDKLDGSDKEIVKGVGDEKKFLKTKLDALLKLRELPKQQIIRQKFSPTQDLRLDDDLFLTYDAGPGPENFCKDYTLVLTPGSVMDSARKDKSHKKQTDTLSKPHELATDILKELDLSSTLTEIKFTPGKEYSFKIKTNIQSFEDITVKFNKNTFGEIETTYFSGNANKNKYIFQHHTDATKKPIIMFMILMKELGDTLQVAWLKDMILRGGFGLTADKTAICTGDLVVWMRSILNKVSCILTHENISTFYPVAGNELQKVAAETLLKRQLRNKMDKNNKELIKSLKEFKDCLNYIDVKFHGKKISSENKVLVSDILTDLIRAVELIHKDLLRNLEPLPDLDSYRDFVANSMFKSPFRILIKSRDIEHITSFTHFLKEKKRYRFFPNLMYSLLYRGTQSITKEQIIGEELMKFLRDNPIVAVVAVAAPAAPAAAPAPAAAAAVVDVPPEPEKPVELPEPILSMVDQPSSPKVSSIDFGSNNINKMTGGGMAKDDFISIIKLNIDKPGFISYYTLVYLPEIITIAYAILYTYNLSVEYTSICAKLFDSKYIGKITESFSKINKDNKFDYNPQDSNENLNKIDSYIINLYKILVYFKKNSIPNRHNIFDYCYDEINWLLENFKEHDIKVELTEINQGKVLDIYQELYDAEAYLTTMNLRDQRSPVEFIPARIKSPIKVVKGKVTKKHRKIAPKNKSQKNKKKNKIIMRKNTEKKKNKIRKAVRNTKRVNNQAMETPPKI
jgi:hypothetical protein